MKKKSACILLVFAAVIVLTYMTGESYYRGISEKAGLDEQEEKIYKYQYDMIVDSPDSQFWQAVYDSAKKKAASNNVLLEIMGSDRETSYNKLDYMNMSIAAKADGIILQYNGEAGLEEAINTAVRNGIPVVTVMSDAVHSRRQSFVGVSDYQLGMAYGEIVARYVNENTKKILILQKRDIDDMNESQIYTQISNAVQTAVGSADIEIKGRNLLSTGTFETEEAVTDIFQQKRNIPDILVSWMKRQRSVQDRQFWILILQERWRSSVTIHLRISLQQLKKVSFQLPVMWTRPSWDSTAWRQLPAI